MSVFSYLFLCRSEICDGFYDVFGWYLGFSFSVASFFRGHRLQFHCWYGNWGIYFDCVPSPLDLCICILDHIPFKLCKNTIGKESRLGYYLYLHVLKFFSQLSSIPSYLLYSWILRNSFCSCFPSFSFPWRVRILYFHNKKLF